MAPFFYEGVPMQGQARPCTDSVCQAFRSSSGFELLSASVRQRRLYVHQRWAVDPHPMGHGFIFPVTSGPGIGAGAARGGVAVTSLPSSCTHGCILHAHRSVPPLTFRWQQSPCSFSRARASFIRGSIRRSLLLSSV